MRDRQWGWLDHILRIDENRLEQKNTPELRQATRGVIIRRYSRPSRRESYGNWAG